MTTPQRPAAVAWILETPIDHDDVGAMRRARAALADAFGLALLERVYAVGRGDVRRFYLLAKPRPDDRLELLDVGAGLPLVRVHAALSAVGVDPPPIQPEAWPAFHATLRRLAETPRRPRLVRR